MATKKVSTSKPPVKAHTTGFEKKESKKMERGESKTMEKREMKAGTEKFKFKFGGAGKKGK